LSLLPPALELATELQESTRKKSLQLFPSEPKSTDPLPWLIDASQQAPLPNSTRPWSQWRIEKLNRKHKDRNNYMDNMMDWYRDLRDQVRIMNIHLESMK
jgi:hypothetical protein